MEKKVCILKTKLVRNRLKVRGLGGKFMLDKTWGLKYPSPYQNSGKSEGVLSDSWAQS